MTFSIVAHADGQWGVAVASKFLAVGAAVPAARWEVGALATQAWANLAYRPDGLALLGEGRTAADVVEALTGKDDMREHRQVGVVDRYGETSAWTGSECHAWAGHLTGAGWSAQGNILVGPEVVRVMGATFVTEQGPLARRLHAALLAGDRAGGDRRGRQSAAVLVVSEGGGYGGGSDVLVDLRVDDHAQPVAELARLYAMHRLLFGKTEQWVEVDDALRDELRERLHALGYDGELEQALSAWAGTENLEERVDGVERIDEVVLQELRAR
jgi:uncharacterized Ntn-hydrolase superfamily protein